MKRKLVWLSESRISLFRTHFFRALPPLSQVLEDLRASNFEAHCEESLDSVSSTATTVCNDDGDSHNAATCSGGDEAMAPASQLTCEVESAAAAAAAAAATASAAIAAATRAEVKCEQCANCVRMFMMCHFSSLAAL